MVDLTSCVFWAKTTKDGSPGISVSEHMDTVAQTARILAGFQENTLERLGLHIEDAASLAGLHDIGKISGGFQRKCTKWLEKYSLVEENRLNRWDAWAKDHARTSQFTMQHILEDSGYPKAQAAIWAMAIGAHHGRPCWEGEQGLQEKAGMRKEDDWGVARKEAALRFLAEHPLRKLPEVDFNSPALWWVAGITTVADWIASDENIFGSNEEEIDHAVVERRVRKSCNDFGLTKPSLKSGLSFQELFDFPPNLVQEQAADFIQEPGLYVIEAPMGSGKTEASLLAAYRLMDQGLATGVYFALPTQITSNRIHLRLNSFVSKAASDDSSTRLIHRNSWLFENVIVPLSAVEHLTDEEDRADVRRWFCTPKRSILAPFGVGTVDQALLSIVAAKHFFLRRCGLAGKVVIIDEVHSYDMYTGTLIDKLCDALLPLGCTIIILSATLTRSRRRSLTTIASEAETDGYPLLSGKTATGRALPERAVAPPLDRHVKVSFLDTEDARARATDAAGNGAGVLWICDTVDSAQETFHLLKEAAAKGGFAIGLLHSRFPFFFREELESVWMERLGKMRQVKPACILVSTQVVEQSVDLNADLLVTELAPTDMLLQRLGRLWRHELPDRPLAYPEVIVLHEAATLEELRSLSAADIVKKFGPKAKVYDPYVLLRTLEVWRDTKELKIPSQIRDLLQSTYTEREVQPKSWEVLLLGSEGMKSAHRTLALMNTGSGMPTLKDDEGVQTRVNEMPTVPLLLVKSKNSDRLELLNGDEVKLTKNASFSLSTAKAINKNVVSVPEYFFSDTPDTDAWIARYISRSARIGVVSEAGVVTVHGLRDIGIRWSNEIGVVLEKPQEG